MSSRVVAIGLPSNSALGIVRSMLFTKLRRITCPDQEAIIRSGDVFLGSMSLYRSNAVSPKVQDCNANRLDVASFARRPPRATAPFASDAIEVLATRLDVSPEAVLASAALLSDAERQRACRFVFDRDRRRFTVARGQLRCLLSVRLGTRPEAVEFVYGAHGKPALAPRCAESDLRFNVSHSDDVAVYAFSTGREIGIDIESIRVIRDAKDIVTSFFSRRENEAYLALEPKERPVGFFNCWTRKEAFIKALGDGLRHPLDSFDVSLTPGEPARLLRVGGTPGNDCGWTLHSFAPGPGLIGAVVFRKFTRESTSKVDPEQIVVRWLPHL